MQAWCFPAASRTIPPDPSNPARSPRIIQVPQEEAEAQRGEGSCLRPPSPHRQPSHQVPTSSACLCCSISVRGQRGHRCRQTEDSATLRVLVRTGSQSLGERRGPKPVLLAGHSEPGPTQQGATIVVPSQYFFVVFIWKIQTSFVIYSLLISPNYSSADITVLSENREEGDSYNPRHCATCQTLRSSTLREPTHGGRCLWRF